MGGFVLGVGKVAGCGGVAQEVRILRETKEAGNQYSVQLTINDKQPKALTVELQTVEEAYP